MKMVCVPCKKFFKVKEIGVVFEEGMPLRTEDRIEWKSYKLWRGDLLECVGCGAQTIKPAEAPYAEHYMPNYSEQKERHKPLVFVEDC